MDNVSNFETLEESLIVGKYNDAYIKFEAQNVKFIIEASKAIGVEEPVNYKTPLSFLNSLSNDEMLRFKEYCASQISDINLIEGDGLTLEESILLIDKMSIYFENGGNNPTFIYKSFEGQSSIMLEYAICSAVAFDFFTRGLNSTSVRSGRMDCDAALAISVGIEAAADIIEAVSVVGDFTELASLYLEYSTDYAEYIDCIKRVEQGGTN